MEVLLVYLIVVNVVAFGVMGIDKYKARRHKRRISEKSIFVLGTIGGGLGVLLGMSFFRHKTKHLKFTWGIPFIVFLNIVMFGYLVQKFSR